MDKNNYRLRRSSRSTLVVAVAGLLSACQSMAPHEAAPAPAPLAAAPALEPIVLPALEYRDTIVTAQLFERLTSRFSWEIAADPTVIRERDWYARNQAYLDRVFTRGELYLFHIVEAL
jgi:hypothetical protein